MTEPSFGTNIRAFRLGWGLAKKHGCWIRMSTAGEENRVELCPVDKVPSKQVRTGFHRRWWNEPSILEMLPWLKPIVRVKQHISVVVNDDGEIVKAEKV